MPTSAACARAGRRTRRRRRRSRALILPRLARRPGDSSDRSVGWRHERRARVHLSRSAPPAYKALDAFSKTVGEHRRRGRASTTRLKELVQIHARSSTAARSACASTSTGPSKAGVDADVIAQIADVARVRRLHRAGACRPRARGGVHLHPRGGHPRRGLRPRRRHPHRAGVRRPELDPRLDQRLQPGRDRRSLPCAAARAGRGAGVTGTRSPRRRRAVNFRDVGGLPAGRRPHALGRAVPLGQSRAARRARGRARSRASAPPHHRPARRRRGRRTRRAGSTGLELTTQRVPLFLGSVASFFETRHVARRDVPAARRGLRGAASSRSCAASLADQPVLVHCTVGKDRTGVTVALALAAAGVDERR